MEMSLLAFKCHWSTVCCVVVRGCFGSVDRPGAKAQVHRTGRSLVSSQQMDTLTVCWHPQLLVSRGLRCGLVSARQNSARHHPVSTEGTLSECHLSRETGASSHTPCEEDEVGHLGCLEGTLRKCVGRFARHEACLTWRVQSRVCAGWTDGVLHKEQILRLRDKEHLRNDHHRDHQGDAQGGGAHGDIQRPGDCERLQEAHDEAQFGRGEHVVRQLIDVHDVRQRNAIEQHLDQLRRLPQPRDTGDKQCPRNDHLDGAHEEEEAATCDGDPHESVTRLFHDELHHFALPIGQGQHGLHLVDHVTDNLEHSQRPRRAHDEGEENARSEATRSGVLLVLRVGGHLPVASAQHVPPSAHLCTLLQAGLRVPLHKILCEHVQVPRTCGDEVDHHVGKRQLQETVETHADEHQHVRGETERRVEHEETHVPGTLLQLRGVVQLQHPHRAPGPSRKGGMSKVVQQGLEGFGT